VLYFQKKHAEANEKNFNLSAQKNRRQNETDSGFNNYLNL